MKINHNHHISPEMQGIANDLNANVHETNETVRQLGSQVTGTVNDRAQQALTMVDQRADQAIGMLDRNAENVVGMLDRRSEQLINETGSQVQGAVRMVGSQLDHGFNVVQDNIQETNHTLRSGVNVAGNVASTIRGATIAGAVVAGGAAIARARRENESNDLATQGVRLQINRNRLEFEESIGRLRRTQEGESVVSHFSCLLFPYLRQIRAHIAIKCSDQTMVPLIQHLIQSSGLLGTQIGHLAVGTNLQHLVNEMEQALPFGQDDQEKNLITRAFVFFLSTGALARRHLEFHPKVDLGPKFMQYGTFVGETTDSEPRHAFNGASVYKDHNNNKDMPVYGADVTDLQRLFSGGYVDCPFYVDGTDKISFLTHVCTGNSRDVASASTAAVGQGGILLGTKFLTKKGAVGIIKITTGNCVGIIPGFGWIVGGVLAGEKVITYLTDRSYTYLYQVTGRRNNPHIQILSLSRETRKDVEMTCYRKLYYKP